MPRLQGRTAAFTAALALALASFAVPVRADPPERDARCPDGREITLVNGRIHTLDADDRVVSSLTIRNGGFASVGHDSGGVAPVGCRQVIQLGGRTVTPGLVDNHNHIVLLGLRPGYHTPLETATSLTTGRNSSGVSINAGQTLTRAEAMRLYTVENGWFSKEEDKIGSIETGKLADLVVLNADYFSVPDEALKTLGSVLTIVGGRIVHDTGEVRVSDR